MRKSYALHIGIMREAISAIEEYRPADECALLASPVRQDAVLMRLRVFGENLARMSGLDEERFAAIVDLSWFQLIGLRNSISHGYEAIDFAIIWRINADELPQFSFSLDRLEER